MTVAVPRHKTAMSRNRLSRPLGQALADELIGDKTTVFDYGCGRGDDLRHLGSLGIAAAGWDPVHRPNAPIGPAEIVNLGYVINVIEQPDERSGVLRQAWSLAERVLIVSGRLRWEQRGLTGRALADGIVTASGTFQKFFEHTELAAWIEQVVGVQPIAAAPGIFYLFRDAGEAQALLARRVTTYRPRLTIDPHALYDAHREKLAPLVEFLSDHGRLPRPDELTDDTLEGLAEAVGGLRPAYRLLVRVTSEEPWIKAATVRQNDLLVYIGLSRFGRRPRLSELPVTLGRDIKVHFGSYQDACAKADRLLYATGQTQLLGLVARQTPLGKRTPSAIYIHRSALQLLPPVLRLYEGCARVLAGEVEPANIVKLSLTDPQVSYLVYPSFDREAHPALEAAVTVNLRALTVDFRDYGVSPNPPILHRKEEFVAEGYPQRALWSKLTAAEVRAGLYEHPERIGTRAGWQATLQERSVMLRGHRLVRASGAAPD